MLLLLFGCGIGKQALAEEPPKFRWAFRLDPGANPFDIGIDELGNSYIVGQAGSSDPLIIGTNVLESSLGTVLLAKFDRSGSACWAVRDGLPLPVAWGVGTDAGHNVYVLCGLFPSLQPISLAGTNISGVLAVAKYDQNGRALHAAPIGRITNSTSRMQAYLGLATDATGNCYWSADLTGTVEIGGNILTSRTPHANIFGKCDPDGNVVWAKLISGNGPNGFALFCPVLAPSETLFVTGSIRDTVDFGETNLSANGSSDIFVAKYNTDGDLLWVRQAGGSGYDFAVNVSADSGGNCFVVGGFFQSATFGEITLNNSVPTSYQFIAKYDANGNVVWAKQLCERSGGIYVATDAAGNSYTAAECATGGVLYAKYSADGEELWRKYGSSLQVNSLKADALGHCHLFGHLPWDSMRADLDGIILTSQNADHGAFLAKLDTTSLQRLEIASASDSVTLSWSVLADDFYLESSPSPSLSAYWNSNSAPPSLVGSSNNLSVSRSSDAMFYRLKHR